MTMRLSDQRFDNQDFALQQRRAINRRLNRQVGQAFLVWMIGALLAYINCETVASWDWISDWVPGIDNSKNATAPEYRCIADALWTYAWICSPLVIMWGTRLSYITQTDELRTVKIRLWGVVFSLTLLIIFGLAVYFGAYTDPYPDIGNSRWASLYKSSGIGVLILTAVIWWAFFAAYFFDSTYFRVDKYQTLQIGENHNNNTTRQYNSRNQSVHRRSHAGYRQCNYHIPDDLP